MENEREDAVKTIGIRSFCIMDQIKLNFELPISSRNALEAFLPSWTDGQIIRHDKGDNYLDLKLALQHLRRLVESDAEESLSDAAAKLEESSALEDFLKCIFFGDGTAMRVESHSNIGHENFAIFCKFSDGRNVDYLNSQDQSRTTPLQAAAVQITQELGGIQTHYDLIQRLKSFIADSNSHSTVRLDPTLASLKTVNAASFKPYVEESTVKGSYKVGLLAVDENGYKRTVNPRLINANTNSIRFEDGTVIPYSSEETDFFRQIQQHQTLTESQAALLSSSPQLLIPAGTDTKRIDLAEYHSRVIGFEALSRMKIIEFNSSGIEWIRNDDGEPMLTAVSTSGLSVTLPMPTLRRTETAVKDLVQQLRESQENVSNYRATPIQVDERGTVFLAPTPENLTHLGAINMLVSKAERGEKVETRRRVIEVAKLQEHRAAIREVTRTELTSEQSYDLVIKKHLYAHQKEGVEWICKHFGKHQGGILLADEMGLGKTAQILVASGLLYHQVQLTKSVAGLPIWRPMLVVAPKILLTNWLDEANTFLKDAILPKRRVVIGREMHAYLGQNGTNPTALNQYDLIATNYETLASYQKELLRVNFSVVAFDESQQIKNPDTAKSIAARGVKSFISICSTGTPVENSLRDLWTQIDATNRIPANPLGANLDEFNELAPDDVGRVSVARNRLEFPGANSIILRREKTVLPNFPKKTVRPHLNLQMTPAQCDLEKNIGRGLRGRTLELLTELRKLYQHPLLLTPKATGHEMSVEDLIRTGPKLKATIQILEEIRLLGEKTLVFTPSVPMQGILHRVLSEYFKIPVPIINGAVNQKGAPGEAAKAIIEQFSKSPGFGILILSPLAAGAGLNITAANHVIHYARWWNPAKEQQATDRAYRIGQKLEVQVYYPILLNDEGRGFDLGLHERVSAKEALARDFLQPLESLDLTPDDVESLYEKEVL